MDIWYDPQDLLLGRDDVMHTLNLTFSTNTISALTLNQSWLFVCHFLFGFFFFSDLQHMNFVEYVFGNK